MIVTNKIVNLEEIFKSDLPIDIEIGFGKGAFILKKAELYKDIFFIGYEIRNKWVEKVQNIIERKLLSNIYVERAFANVIIPEKIPNNRIRHIYINFPDPWWKRKHKKRLILQKDFIKLFYNTLEDKGKIYIRTDVKDYADLIRKNFEELETFVEIEHDIVSDKVYTNREVSCLENDLDIYYLAFQKVK